MSDGQQVSTGVATLDDGRITREKIDDAVRKIVTAANPLRVVLFGSWARGRARPDSDLDLAVTLDEHSMVRGPGEIYVALGCEVSISLDILAFSNKYHDLMKVSVNSVHGDIDREGVVLYERAAHGSTSRVVAA